MKGSASQPQCAGTNKRGDPCEATIVGPDGFCRAHSPNGLDMRELGRKGGKASVRSRLGLGDDLPDALRGKARKRLDAALDDPDPRIRLQAARAIASYSPERPPAEQQPEQQQGRPLAMSIGDLCAAAVELGVLEGDNLRIGGRPVSRTPQLSVEQATAPDAAESPKPAPAPRQAPPALDELTDDGDGDFWTRLYGDDRASGYEWK
jgi:hypothetical protein